MNFWDVSPQTLSFLVKNVLKAKLKDVSVACNQEVRRRRNPVKVQSEWRQWRPSCVVHGPKMSGSIILRRLGALTAELSAAVPRS